MLIIISASAFLKIKTEFIDAGVIFMSISSCIHFNNTVVLDEPLLVLPQPKHNLEGRPIANGSVSFI